MSAINVINKNVVVQVASKKETTNIQAFEEPEKKCQFHFAIKNVLVMAQIFGLLPVYGIKDQNIENIKFKWLSYKTIYSIVIFSLVLLNGILYLVEFTREDLNFAYLGMYYYLSYKLNLYTF